MIMASKNLSNSAINASKVGKGWAQIERETYLLRESRNGYRYTSFHQEKNLVPMVLTDEEKVKLAEILKRYAAIIAKDNVRAQFDKEYTALMDSLEPSPCDADILYDSLPGFIDAAASKKRFLVMGDANHGDEAIQNFIYGDNVVQSVVQAGYSQLYLELPPAFEPFVRDHARGMLNEGQALGACCAAYRALNGGSDSKTLLSNALALSRQVHGAGMEIFCMDDDRGPEPGQPFNIVERIKADDGFAAYIKARAGRQAKAWVIAGALHGAYKGGLDDQLGGEDAVARVNIHADLGFLKRTSRGPLDRVHIDNPPRYCYSIKHDIVVQPREDYGRKVDINCDPVQSARRLARDSSYMQLLWEKMASSGKEAYWTGFIPFSEEAQETRTSPSCLVGFKMR